MKQTHSFLQGSPEWAEHRRKYLNASDASAAMGLSRFKTRSELMRDMATGITVEYDEATLARFAKGHEFEAIARPWAEEIIGSDLFPVVMSDEIDGLPLSASFDGIDMAEEFTFEHKTANAALLAALESGDIPAEYKPQMEQGLLISGATRCLFMASAGDKDAMRYAWYESDPDVRAGLLAAWAQFHEDLKNYTPPEVIPAAVAAPIKDLPALTIEISGSVVASNLAQWKDVVTERIASIKTDLQTDQDFADADNMVKFLDDGEKRIEIVKAQAQSQATSIDEVFRALDDIKASMRAKRLELDKLVTARKVAIRSEIVMTAKAAYDAHVESLKAETGGPWIALAPPDFAGAIKSKRTVASLRDAVDTALAHGKIAADESAKKIRANLACIKEDGAGFEFLFADKLALIGKPIDDLQLIIRSRIADHKIAEEKRLAAERERIAAEERAKAERQLREAKALAATDRAKQEEAAHQHLAGIAAAETIEQDRAQKVPAPSGHIMAPPPEDDVESVLSLAAVLHAAAPAAIANIIAPIDTGARLKLGEIGERLGFTLTAEFLASLGFSPVETVKAAKLYREADFSAICAALVRHVQGVAHQVMQKAA